MENASSHFIFSFLPHNHSTVLGSVVLYFAQSPSTLPTLDRSWFKTSYFFCCSCSVTPSCFTLDILIHPWLFCSCLCLLKCVHVSPRQLIITVCNSPCTRRLLTYRPSSQWRGIDARGQFPWFRSRLRYRMHGERQVDNHTSGKVASRGERTVVWEIRVNNVGYSLF